MGSSAKAKVLIVDDSVEMGRLIAERLTNAGYLAEFVNDGAKAVARFQKQLFDVVVTDHRMDHVDRFDVLRSVKACSPTTMVVIMAAFGNIETAVEAMRRGAYHCITKPFQFSELLLLIERAVAERRLRDENE